MEDTPGEVLVQLNDCLVNLQAILKCSICCSTLRDPVTPSCNHAFCKECLEGVFQRRYSIECPVCRQKITKRSARTPSEHVSGLVTLYLQLVQCFKADIKDSNPIPKDKFILESQALTQAAGCPLKEVNLKEPEHTVRKKRKNAEALSNRKKVSRYDQNDENFVVPTASTAQFKENKNNKKNEKQLGAHGKALDFTEPLSVAVPVINGRKSPVQNVNVNEEVSRQENKPVVTKTTSSDNIDHNTEQVETKPTFFKIPYAEHKPSLLEITTSVNEARPTDQHNLLDLDDAIKQRKLAYQKCSDMEAFFLLFPTAQGLFKRNLPELLRALDINSYNEQCQFSSLSKKPTKFEIPILGQDVYTHDSETKSKLVNNLQSNTSPEPIKKTVTCTVACQTDQNLRNRLQTTACQTDEKRTNELQTAACQTEENRTVEVQTIACQTEENRTVEIQTIACQTEQNTIAEEDVVPASEPELNDTVEAACQTEGLLRGELFAKCSLTVLGAKENSQSVVPPSECTSRINMNSDCRTDVQRIPRILPNNETASQKERQQLPQIVNISSDEFSTGKSQIKDRSLPAKPIIVVSRRQSANDNELLNLFKCTFGNVQIRTEFTNKATHLVMMNKRDSSPARDRSLIYVQSIINRLEIVNRTWIDDCLKSRTLLDTNRYKIELFNYLPWYVKKPIDVDVCLFNRFLFYLPYRYFSADAPHKREQIIQLITSTGGQIASNAEDFLKVASVVSKEFKSYSTSKYKDCIIVFSSFCKEADAARCVSEDLKASVVSADYILDCICENLILPKDRYFIKYRIN